jgi:hypothetical protein
MIVPQVLSSTTELVYLSMHIQWLGVR